MITKIIKFALNTIPRPWLIRLSYPVQWAAPIFLKGDKFIDPIDGRGYRKFFPYGYGDTQRENALGPGTNSLERHRLLWLYLKNETDFLTAPKKVMHIAPEQCFYGRFKKLKNLDYTTADLFSPLADMKFDVMDIPLGDDLYDVVFCNHVLEHIPDDTKAMQELYRVLKPGGHFSVSDIVLEGELPEALRHDAEMYAGCVAGAIQKTEYLNYIKEAGFKNITIQKSKPIVISSYEVSVSNVKPIRMKIFSL